MENKEKYLFCPPEQDDWCVPSALQTILKRRDIDLTQTEIVSNFERAQFGGYHFDNDSLGYFLQRFGLKSHFFHPFKRDYGDDFNWKELDGTLKRLMPDSEKDLIASYDPRVNVGHVSVVSGYDSGSRLVQMIDLEDPILLNNLLNQMKVSIEEVRHTNKGFYLIG